MPYRILGSNYLWSPGDGLPALPALPGFRASPTIDAALLAQLSQLAPPVVAARLQAGHLAYLAWLEDAPVAYGWVATRRHGIEELGLDYELPARRRALWDFGTLAPWRGRGVYPRLLQAILGDEAPHADWFEICHVAGNTASERGILAAGFRLIGQLVTTHDGQLRLAPGGDPARARQSAMGQAVGFLPGET